MNDYLKILMDNFFHIMGRRETEDNYKCSWRMCEPNIDKWKKAHETIPSHFCILPTNLINLRCKQKIVRGPFEKFVACRRV
jgi:hypothetical protein